MANIQALKSLSLQDFKKLTGHDEDLYNKLKNSKEGFITIVKLSDNPNFHISQGETRSGLTQAFGEGLSLNISSGGRWFKTSNITKINWEDEKFEKLN